MRCVVVVAAAADVAVALEDLAASAGWLAGWLWTSSAFDGEG